MNKKKNDFNFETNLHLNGNMLIHSREFRLNDKPRVPMDVDDPLILFGRQVLLYRRDVHKTRYFRLCCVNNVVKINRNTSRITYLFGGDWRVLLGKFILL